MKYRFEIHFINKTLKEIGKRGEELDLGINFYAIKETITLSSTKNPSIDQLKQIIIESYQINDCEVLHIEGGLIE